MTLKNIGESLLRKDGWEKVTEKANYINDFVSPELYHARMVVSPYAHAIIKQIDTSEAWKVPPPDIKLLQSKA